MTDPASFHTNVSGDKSAKGRRAATSRHTTKASGTLPGGLGVTGSVEGMPSGQSIRTSAGQSALVIRAAREGAGGALLAITNSLAPVLAPHSWSLRYFAKRARTSSTSSLVSVAALDL